MFSAVEESSGQTMQAKPRWVLAGGCILAFLAAAVNADFMLRLGVSVSHLTGDLSRITSEAVEAGGHWSREAAAFALGSTVGAILTLKTTVPVTVACGATYVSGGIVWSVLKRWLSPNLDA